MSPEIQAQPDRPMSFVGRFVVPISPPFHAFELSGDPTSVGSREDRSLEFWSVVRPDAVTTRRAFMVVGTGQPMPAGFLKVWGHAYIRGGAIVWHLVEYPISVMDDQS